VVVAEVPFPLRDAHEVVDAILSRVTERTRLALIDHVTAPTGFIVPVEALVKELAARGVDTLLDGAHALGMIPLQLDRIGAAYYTANAHKWLCAPKGAAVLHVRRDRQERIHPLVVSHGYDPAATGNRFRAEFDWNGTDDPTAHLSMPENIRYLGGLLPGGWPELQERNHALAARAREILCEAVGIPKPTPDAMLGSLAAIPLPPAAPGSPAAANVGASLLDQAGLARWLRERGVEPIVFSWPRPGNIVLRVSAQLYNDEAQYRRLAALLREALGA
jgi:isopenicillin-N epimerase